MNLTSIQGLHYQTGQKIEIHIENGLIVAISQLEKNVGHLPVIAPGLVDLQVNGFGGVDFNQGPVSQEELTKVISLLYAKGVSCFFPTLITQDPEVLVSAANALGKHMENLGADSIGGIHLEGPFISPEDGARGAHPLAYVRPPDKDLFMRIQDAAGGKIRMLTLSPEWPGSAAFIHWCVQQDIKVAIGHTAASAEQIRGAVAAGAGFSTHLGNGAHLMLPRHPNYVWEQLACDELAASIIADGFHLPDAFMKVAIRTKGQGLFLVSDSTALAGMPAGIYEASIGGKVRLEESGRLCLANQPKILAGSAVPLLDCVNYLYLANLCSWQQAWDMASVIPDRLMQLYPLQGIIKGAPANLVTLTKGDDEAWRVEQTVIRGKLVFGNYS